MEPPNVPTELAFRATLWTRWVDEDNQSVLNNAVYMTLLEEARHRYFSARGLLSDNRFPFLLAQCDIRFLHPGTGGREVTVEVTTTRLGNSSFSQAYRVSGDQVWCEAEALLVCVGDDGRPTPMTSGFREALESDLA